MINDEPGGAPPTNKPVITLRGTFLVRGALWTLPFWVAPFLALASHSHLVTTSKLDWLLLLGIFHCIAMFALSLIIARAAGFFDAVWKGLKISAWSSLAAFYFGLELSVTSITGGAAETLGFYPGLFMFGVLALAFASVAGAVTGLLFRNISGRATAAAAAEPEPEPPPAPLSPDEQDAAQAAYSALREHKLYDLHTARAYHNRSGNAESGSSALFEKRYAEALAWLETSRPGFSQVEWEAANGLIFRLVGIARTSGSEEGAAAELARLCPGLGEDFRGWILQASHLFK